MRDGSDLLAEAGARAQRYHRSLADRPVVPSPSAVEALAGLGGPLPERPADPTEVLALLDDLGSPATVASAGGRYFGFVTGSAIPVTIAANWLAAAWNQNAGMWVQSPVAVRLESIALAWLTELLALPSGCGGGLATGATMANF